MPDDRGVLRESIRVGMREAMYRCLVDDAHCVVTMWCDTQLGREWEGPYVTDECQAAYDAVCAWLAEAEW